MHIVDVVPLTNIPIRSPQVLSYFYKEKLEPGSLVSVPLSGRKVKAIVQNSSHVQERKLELKRKSFELKRISKIICSVPVLSNTQIQLGQYLHEYYLSSLGAVLKLFIPKKLISRKTEIQLSDSSSGENQSEKSVSSPTLLWKKNRLIFYLKEIKKNIPKGQTLLLEPEISRAKADAAGILQEASINNSEISIVHGELASSKEFEEWQKIREGKSKVIIGTRSSVFFPYKNLKTIMINNEENSSYKSWQQYPKYNAKRIAEKLAEIHNTKLILGSNLPSVETYRRAEKGKYNLEKETQSPEADVEMIDMKKEKDEKRHLIFSELLIKKIREKLESNEKIILFVNRRGAATSVICRDCGHAVECEKCKAPMVYHKNKKGNDYLMCHHCGAKRSTPEICPNCGGHRIKYFGIGTQKVKQVAQKLFQEAKIMRLDSDNASNYKEQKEILSTFISEADILIGTRLLLKLKRFDGKINLVGAALVDPLLNFPDFRAQENAFNILFNLKGMAESLVLQTYNPDLSVFGYIRKNKVEEFYESELTDRKQFLYPPFSDIIKISFSNKKSKKAEVEAEKFKDNIDNEVPKEILEKTEVLGPTPAFIPKVRDQYIWNVVLKTKVQEELKRRIKLLIPNKAKVDVDPIQIL